MIETKAFRDRLRTRLIDWLGANADSLIDNWHFDRYELACKCGCGFAAMDIELLAVLEDVRAHFGQPVSINSGCRCEAHNKAISGAPNSYHCKGLAADIRVKDTPPEAVQAYLRLTYLDKYGIGCYATFTHIDVRAGCWRG